MMRHASAQATLGIGLRRPRRRLELSSRQIVDRTVATALAFAGVIHLVLIPSHFAESFLFGVTFVAIAAFQLSLAAALLRRPGDRTYRLALVGSLLLVAIWAGTRFFGPPTGTGPEDVDIWGVLAVGLELGAVVLLASSVPSLGGEARHRGLWASAGAVGFALVYLLATGSAGAGSPHDYISFLQVDILRGEFSVTIPAAVLSLDHGRVFLALPWSTAVFLPIAAALIAWQIHMALGASACKERLAARRRGVLSVVPALFAAPVCCGVPLLSFLGTSAVVSLSRLTPWLLIATCLLLAAGTYNQIRIRQGGRN